MVIYGARAAGLNIRHHRHVQKSARKVPARTSGNVTNSEKRNFENVPPLNPNNF
jgi:hypothetical protein